MHVKMPQGIRLHEVTKIYGGKTVLDRITLIFKRSGRYCITGPSGCGKTTLLHIMMGIVTPDGGHVCVQSGADGADQATQCGAGVLGSVLKNGAGAVVNVPQNGKGCVTVNSLQDGADGAFSAIFAPVFQENRLCENLSVGSNIRLTARAKLSAARINDMLERLMLPGIIHNTVRNLSGGMKRRVAIARALLSGGNILVLDEPFKELDGPTKLAAAGAVLEAIGDKTLVIVSHDPDVIRLLNCENIAFS